MITVFPVGDTYDPFMAQDDRRAFIGAVGENSGGPAYLALQFATYGSGEVRHPELLHFGLGFVKRPAVSYGFSLRMSRLPERGFPRCGGGIWKWRKNLLGLYVGAYAFVTVECDAELGVTHSFGFSGMALKSVVNTGG